MRATSIDSNCWFIVRVLSLPSFLPSVRGTRSVCVYPSPRRVDDDDRDQVATAAVAEPCVPLDHTTLLLPPFLASITSCSVCVCVLLLTLLPLLCASCPLATWVTYVWRKRQSAEEENEEHRQQRHHASFVCLPACLQIIIVMCNNNQLVRKKNIDASSSIFYISSLR